MTKWWLFLGMLQLQARPVRNKKNDPVVVGETQPVVPQKTAPGTRVLVMLLISLLVVFAGLFALLQDKWRVWQDEITNWWAELALVQTMS